MTLLQILFVVTIGLVLNVTDIAAQRSTRPHIIFILADDLGWNDVAFHGETEIPTPNLDALAADGILLNQYYVLPLCTPSRASLMTGRYAANVGLQNNVIDNAGPWGLPTQFTIMPEYFKSLGYRTRMVGKWHLGFYRSTYTPMLRGFDSHYGFWGSNTDHFHHTGYSQWPASNFQGVPESMQNESLLFVGLDFRDDMDIERTQQERYLADVYTERVKNILRTHNKEEPLFLYVAHHCVHRGDWLQPIRAPDRYVEGFQFIRNLTRQQFAGAVTALDVSVGRIFETLQETGMLENSIVVFSTDNGADFATFTSNAGSNWPLRGQKFTNWEGGVRGVGLIWSPLLRINRRVSDQMMHISDWLPTLYRAAGGDLSTLPELDGVNMWDALSEDLPSPRNETLINLDQIWNMSAVRSGDFKLLSGSFLNQDLDSWFGPSAREVAPSGFRSHSRVADALRALYNDDGLELKTPVVNIDCGPRPANPESKCDPFNAPCLFNIRLDPCEYNNIASQNPQLTERLTLLLQVYNARAYPPQNRPLSYISNPALYDGLWVPFFQDEAEYQYIFSPDL